MDLLVDIFEGAARLFPSYYEPITKKSIATTISSWSGVLNGLFVKCYT